MCCVRECICKVARLERERVLRAVLDHAFCVCPVRTYARLSCVFPDLYVRVAYGFSSLINIIGDGERKIGTPKMAPSKLLLLHRRGRKRLWTVPLRQESTREDPCSLSYARPVGVRGTR